MSARDLLKLARADGWTARTTNGGHLKLTHPLASTVVFTGSTPSCPRALANTRAQMKRALPAETKAPKPERPKRRPKPKPRTIETAIDWQAPPEPELPAGVGGSAPRRPPRPLPGGPSGFVTTRWP